MKKIVSVLLAVVLIFSLVLPLTAAAIESDGTPIVYVQGFGRSTLTLDAGEKSELKIYKPAAKTVLKAIAEFSLPYTRFKVDGDYEKLGDAALGVIDTILGSLECDENGNSVNNITVTDENVVTAQQEYGQLNYFYYDWRFDVTETADTLNDYINAILDATGKKKICLICESMGGCVGASYLVKYGYSKCSSIILSSAATMGVQMFNDLFDGKFQLRSDKLYGYLCAYELFREIDLTKAIIYAFDQLGGFETVLRDVCIAAEKIQDKLYSEFVFPFISKMPGIWAFIFDENVEKFKEKTGIVKGSELEKKIDNYHLNVRPVICQTLQNAMNSGVKVAIISGYNLTCTPITSNDDYQSDYLIATKETSFGAKTADIGSTLGEEYTQAVSDGHDHISPDRLIDASTCAFPENTWFVKNLTHTRKDIDFFCWVAYTDGEVNISANDSYPQFLKYKNPHYLANTGENGNTDTVFFRLLTKLIDIAVCAIKKFR